MLRQSGMSASLRLGILLVLCSLGAAQGATLDEVLRIASARDATVLSMRQQVARSTTDIEAAKDGLRPSLSFAADTTTASTSSPALTLTISQVLFDWGLTKSQVKSATHERVKAVTELKSAVEDLALDMSLLFIEVDVANLKLDRTIEYLGFARRIEEISRRRVAGGVANSSEIGRARLEVARAEDQLAQLEVDRQTALAQLEFFTGAPVGSLSSPPSLAVTQRFPSSAAIIGATMNAPAYLSAKADVAIAQTAIETVKAARKPKIVLKAQGLQELNGGRGRSGSIGLTTAMDLDAGDFRGRAKRAAEQDLAVARSRLLAVERMLQNELRTNVERIRSLAATEASQAEQLAQASVVREAYEQQFVGGQRELVDVLASARDFYDAQIDKIDTYDERISAEYEAAHSVGMLGTLIVATIGR